MTWTKVMRLIEENQRLAALVKDAERLRDQLRREVERLEGELARKRKD